MNTDTIQRKEFSPSSISGIVFSVIMTAFKILCKFTQQLAVDLIAAISEAESRT